MHATAARPYSSTKNHFQNSQDIASSPSENGNSKPHSENNGSTQIGCTKSAEAAFSSGVSEARVVENEAEKKRNGSVSMRKGPDELLPAENIWTTDRETAVKILVEEDGPQAEKPVSVMTAFRETVEKAPNHTAIAVKRDGKWTKFTYREYYDLTRLAAKGFIALGLERYHAVGILGFNSPEWFISDLAAIFAGGISCGIYTTNTPEACQHVANNAKCNIIVVENDVQLQKILKVRDQLPHLRAIIQYIGKPKAQLPDVYSWDELLENGKLCSDKTLQERIEQQAPNLCCTLIYTSGTTGNPKGVMLSHDNLVWTAKMAGVQERMKFEQEVFLSYLPLSHVAAQVVDIFIPFVTGGTIYFAQPDALRILLQRHHMTALITDYHCSTMLSPRLDPPDFDLAQKENERLGYCGLDLGSLGDTLKEVRPTVFLGVPRVWEKIQEKMQSASKASSFFKRRVARWAKGVGFQGNMALCSGGTKPNGWSLANKLVFTKVRHALGMDRCRLSATAAAPIMKDTLDFFMSLNIPLMEIYGMSETSGPHTVSTTLKYRPTSVGVEMIGTSTKIDSPDQDGNGEMCLKGRNIFMGYLNEVEATTETFDAKGWMHSGDIGRKDADGFFYVTGRIKELLITAGAENVAPVPIEDAIQEQLPCISNCMLVGDKRKFLSVLLTLKVEVDPETAEPTDKLSPFVLDWYRSVGCDATTVSEILKKQHKPLMIAIQEGIDRTNAKAISRAQFVQKWTILPRDFSIQGGELGPTMKLKRSVVSKMYATTIESLYANSGKE